MDKPSPLPRGRHLLFWTLAGVGCAVDLWTKHWMFSRPSLLAGEAWWLWPNHAGFQLSLNEGALFGMGQGNVWFFAACSLAAAAAIPLWLFFFGGARDRALTVVLGCIMGGVLGNLYDRAGFSGLRWESLPPHFNVGQHPPGPVHAVRDFILLAWRWDADWQNRVVWPNFNVADSLLVCGALALLILSFRKPADDAVGQSPATVSLQKPTT
jgi:signal peptidase II